MLSDLLGNILKTYTNTVQQDGLEKACKDFEQFDPKLPRRIVSYVVSGESDSVLTDLQQLTEQQLQEVTLHQTRLMIYYLKGGQSGSGFENNVRAYNYIDFLRSALLCDFDVARRLGNVLASCGRELSISTVQNPSLPGWIRQLLDVLNFAYIHDANSQTGVEPAPFQSVTWLFELAKANGIDKESIWIYLLELRANAGYFAMPAIERFLIHVDHIGFCQLPADPHQLEKLSIAARCELIRFVVERKDKSNLMSLAMLLHSDSSKVVRDKAKALLPFLDTRKLALYLESNYRHLNATLRKHWVEIAPECLENGESLLKTWRQTETAKAVLESIEKVLSDKAATNEVAQAFANITLPSFVALPDSTPLPEQLKRDCFTALELLAEHKKERARQEVADNKENNTDWTYAQKELQELQALTSKDIAQELVAIESGVANADTHKVRRFVAEAFSKARVLENSDIELMHLINYINLFPARCYQVFDHSLFEALARTSTPQLNDYRQIVEYYQRKGFSTERINDLIFKPFWGDEVDELPTGVGDTIKIWPFLIEQKAILDHRLFNPKDHDQFYRIRYFERAIWLLKYLPKLPTRYSNFLYELALGDAKISRSAAQQVLDHFEIDIGRVTQALCSGKQELRIQAARWLAKLNAREAIPALEQMVDKEKRESAKAEGLAALSELGQDISAYLSPDKLLKEAQLGLKKAIPKSMAWFPFEQLPALSFSDGSKVDAKIIRWWIVLAVKLKEPGANPLLLHYLRLLDRTSQHQLGRYVFSAFVGQDTACPSDSEAHEYAQENKAQRYANWQRYANTDWGADYANKTVEDAYKWLFKSHKETLLGSAIKDKGMLCLISGMIGAEAVELVSRYMKQHYTRRHQIEAMLTSLANSDDMAAIQLLLSTARRYRTHSVQETARTLIERIAERNGWSQDELADRTIPSAGFSVAGEMETFELGNRELKLALTSDLKISILNEQGKALKSLPQARQDDDTELYNQAKKQFNANKKELKQVIALQTQRLFEAMCCGREWTFADWQEYLWQHPVMYHLVQRLVWQFEIGNQWVAARPSDDGELLDLDDEELETDEITQVRLASGHEFTAEQLKLWLAHMKDYKVKPLFEQLAAAQFNLASIEPKQTQLTHFRGFLSDTFTLRGLLTKRGYQRSAAEDGGTFFFYFKEFQSLGYRLIFEFSGSQLPEENMAAAIYSVGVVPLSKSNYWREQDFVPLNELNKSLLNAMALDYERVAAKCSEDANWKSKLPW
ncbi:hypothetical protein PRUB_a1877 [Pseudoalteromonas rubra]|uniref:DUF4132 domain-containing protein n=1 Tax=Pseudoalteromonas rubra TaxID=43658 RepID=A0A8T0CDM3_9GAMM|nr:DUF4132 domain-containing protein [Pseudoalteromonas rubra]KAF7788806.1 hypothetical protein PRUB_a1877 [Pseudoalteromonas rubra]